METINDLLNQVSEKVGARNKNQLANALGLSRQGIQHAVGRDRMSDETAAIIAKVLERDEEEIVVIANYWRATDSRKGAWERISKLLNRAKVEKVAMLLLSIVIFSTFENATSAFSLLCKKLQYFKHRKKQELSRLFASTENDNLAVLNIQ